MVRYSLEDYRIRGKYLARDILYEDGSIAISATKFNSYQYPLFYVLSILGPLEKEMSADFAPLLVNDSDYRFADTRTTTIVTRRDVSPLSTVKGSNKDLYIAYDKDYYILDADQAAVEIRIAFGLSEVDEIIRPLTHEETDPHIETASQMLRKPAFLIDRKKERAPIKFINFGRIYKRGAYSICKQIFGVVTKDLKAFTEQLLALFDEDKAAVHQILDQYRHRAIQPQEVPAWLRWFLKMEDDTEFGKMDNTFGFAQHVNLSRDESWYIPVMQRKAGNFAVQGLASNLLRVLYTRFVESCWERGWIQDGRIIIHTTIYDEILLSFHKSINPFELIACLRDAFVVKYRKFPPLFLGVNIARSWGDTKDDNYEIPSILLANYSKEFKAGQRDTGHEGDDYVDFFLKDIVRYKQERIKKEIKITGFDKSKILEMETFSETFTSYYVRSLLLEFKGFLFKIDDYSDPVEVLASTLLYFISSQVLEDGEILKVRLRGKLFGITNKTWMIFFESEHNLINGIKSEQPLIQVEDDDAEEDDIFYSFNDYDEDYYVDGDMNLTNWSLPVDYDPSTFKLPVAMEPAKYTNFTVRAGCVLLRCSSQDQIKKIKNFLLGRTTTSTESVKIFYRFRSMNQSLGSYKESTLAEMDKKEELWT